MDCCSGRMVRSPGPIRPVLAALLALLVVLGQGAMAANTPVIQAPAPAARFALSANSLGTDLIKGAAQPTPPLTNERSAVSAGSFSVGKVHVLGVPVIAVAVPVLKGSQGLDAQARAALIEANLQLLYAPEVFCNQTERLSEGLLAQRAPGHSEAACQSDPWGISGDPNALRIVTRIGEGGQPVLEAEVPGRSQPLPLLTVTDADARVHGLPAPELAQRWARLLQQRLQQARRELEPGRVFVRLRQLALLEALVFAVLVLLVWCWTRTRRWLKSLLDVQLDHPSSALQLRLQLVMVLRRGLFLSVLVGVMVMVALAVMAVPGQLTLGLTLLLQPGRALLKVVAIGLVMLASRMLVALLLRQWATDARVPVVERARREQRYRSLHHILNRLIELAGIVVVAIWIVADVPGVRALSSQVLLVGGALLGALAIVFQGLLRDFVAGLVVFLEDRYAIGDWIEVDRDEGEVLDVGILSTQLRTLDQRVVVVQHSAAQRVVNHTKIRSGCVVRVTLAHPVASVPAALAVVQQVLDDLAADASWGPELLEPPRLLGVQDLLPSGVVLSMQLVTMAGTQWRVRRELLRRIAEALQSAGIALAHWPELPAPASPTPGS